MSRVPVSSQLSVIIPARNEADRIPHLFAALAAQTLLPQEIIVVDNASTDATSKVVQNHAHQFAELGVSLRLLSNPELGIAKTRNTGFFAARTPLLASTDADCIPAPTWAERIDQFFTTHPEALAVAGKTVMYDAPVPVRWLTELGWYSWYYWLMKKTCGFQFLGTNNCAVRRGAFGAVGGFAERIASINGLDDVELASRLALRGLVAYDPSILCGASFRRYAHFWRAVHTQATRGRALTQITQQFHTAANTQQGRR